MLWFWEVWNSAYPWHQLFLFHSEWELGTEIWRFKPFWTLTATKVGFRRRDFRKLLEQLHSEPSACLLWSLKLTSPLLRLVLLHYTVEGAIPIPVLKASAGFPARGGSGVVYPERLGTQRELWDLLPSSMQSGWGERTKHGAVQKPQTCKLSKSCRRPVCISLHGSQISEPQRGQERLFSRSQPKWKGKTNLLCLVSIDST